MSIPRRTWLAAVVGWLFAPARTTAQPLPQQQVFLMTQVPVEQWEKYLKEAKEAGLKQIDCRFAIGFQGLSGGQVEYLIDKHIRLDSVVPSGSFRLRFYDIQGRRSFEVRRWIGNTEG